ncbi:MAG: FkbM family methyltransferase [Pseudomonadota bacterium]
MTGLPDITLPPGVRVDTCRHGIFASLEGDTHVGRALRAYGEWAEGELKVLNQILRPGDVVVDAGANIGALSVPFAKRVGPEGRVFAFEPQPRLNELLTVNGFLNGLDNLVPVLAGLGAKAGTARFPDRLTLETGNFGSITLDPFIRRRVKGERFLEVPIGPLDEMLELDRLRLIKADIEHMELALIQGAIKTIERHRPVILLENSDPDETDPLLEAMTDLGYQGYWLAEFIFRKDNFNANPENLFETEACANILFVPEAFRVQKMTKVTGRDSHPFARAEAVRAAREAKAAKEQGAERA